MWGALSRGPCGRAREKSNPRPHSTMAARWATVNSCQLEWRLDLTDTRAAPYPGKSPELISLGDGLNYSSPLAQVQGTVVPNPLFFLRSNNKPPDVNAASWSVRINGRVKRPMTLDLAAVRAMPGV